MNPEELEMLRKLLIVWIGIMSIISLIYFSEVNGFTNGNNTYDQKRTSNDIVRFTIKPVTLRLFPGGSMQLIAVAYNSKGEKITVSPLWKIKSGVSSLGEFDRSEGERVIFSAINSGSGSIIAVYNDLEAEVHVEIYKKKK
jgi:hypothetical protein